MLESEVFDICYNINELILNSQMDTARTEVIKLLDRLNREGKEYSPMVNHFIREVGLFPYIDKNTASWQEQAVFEAYKTDLGGGEQKTLHSAQSRVLKRLLAGDNIALSAPTSFGKSFIIDAFISIRKPDNVVIIVPTIALADETRRRIEHKFSEMYKIITTTDATLRERNILILPQERSFAYVGKFESIDMLIVDEFYKASSSFDDSRSTSLLSAMIELGKIAKQKYYLAPNTFSSDSMLVYFLQHVNLIQVAIARGFHLFPFRTEKLSLVTPMVLRNSGRVGSRRLEKGESRWRGVSP